jgi:mycothiol synthase
MSIRADGLVIEEIDVRSLSDEAIDEINVFRNVLRAEAAPEDPPMTDEVARAGYRVMPSFIVPRAFVVRDEDGSLIAQLETTWEREENNQHLLDVQIAVHPSHRRRGIGAALLGVAVEVADAATKTLMILHTSDRVPAGEAFARRIGADAALVGHTNRLAIADVDRAMVERWVAEGPERAPGYSLVTVDGPAPDDLIDHMVDVLHVMNTAPTEGLDVEDQTFTVSQMRDLEALLFASGAERRYIAARHDATGELVGFTEMWKNQNGLPQTVSQWGTGVRPEHRGHALGKWLKAANIVRLLDEWPDVVDIRTHNADSNDPMLGINHALGFKPYTVDIHWQLPVDEARKYVAR